ncbi:hypothetical protein DDV96_00785 [Marixanthomonas spongiae]|uniref:PorT family protein n=2 Tax=Marixanthomonas spongiae TaxID=2174845 RepID=A0A2U0I7R4_9FLAO|nr:hypothetical protein DDV96_00785 [Marixanthomonas spongiae]
MYCTVVTVWVLTIVSAQAQENDAANAIAILKAAQEQIIAEEKEALTNEVENINQRLEQDEISIAEAKGLKEQAAEKRALNIENRLAIIDNKIALLERNGKMEEAEGSSISIGVGSLDQDNDRVFGIKVRERGTAKKRKYDRRTTSAFVFAFGLNNVMTEGESLNDSDFKIGGSRFAEIGWAWRTRVFKNTNWFRVKYGFSFQFNGLKPTDNRYYVDTGDQTELQEFPLDLDKSKFRMDNLVFPVHFEFGPSEKIEKDGYFRYNTYNKIKVGLGGYAGFNLGSRQKLKYSEDGEDVKEKLKASYNTNNFIYGLSGYLGWKWAAVYVKYDLNTIFKDNPIDQRNISLGLRFDVD